MVWSSPDNLWGGSPPPCSDVAACWGIILAGAVAMGAARCKSWFRPNPVWRDVGRHGHGRTAMCQTLPIEKRGGGCRRRCNLLPTGGRQQASDGLSGNGMRSGDDGHRTGAVVLPGATWADRRIAQACHAVPRGSFGVRDLFREVSGERAGNLGDTPGPARAVDNSVRVNRDFGTSARLKVTRKGTDCRASHVCVARRTAPSGRDTPARSDRRTWEGLSDITPGNRGGLRLGAVMSRFKRCEQGWPCKSRGQADRPGRKWPSERGGPPGLLGRPARTRGQHAPAPRSHGLAPTRSARFPGWLPADVWFIMLRHAAITRARCPGVCRRVVRSVAPQFEVQQDVAHSSRP